MFWAPAAACRLWILLWGCANSLRSGHTGAGAVSLAPWQLFELCPSSVHTCITSCPLSQPLPCECVSPRPVSQDLYSYYNPTSRLYLNLESILGSGGGLGDGQYAWKGSPGSRVPMPGPGELCETSRPTPVPILQMSKLRPRDVEAPARGHPANPGQSRGSPFPHRALSSALPSPTCSVMYVRM